jgi:ABC-2 type transport system permease protein
MMFWRVLRAEFMKLRRTAAVKIALLAPTAVVTLVLFIASQLSHTSLRRVRADNDWSALAHVTFIFWGLLMLPHYVTVQASLVAGIDHGSNQWKSILARPVPRYAFYLAKLIVASALTAGSTILLVVGVSVTGAILPHIQSVAAFNDPMPAAAIAREGLKCRP